MLLSVCFLKCYLGLLKSSLLSKYIRCFICAYKGDCPAVPVCQEHESCERSIYPGCLSEDATLHLHHPPWHDQSGALSRCVNTRGHIISYLEKKI